MTAGTARCCGSCCAASAGGCPGGCSGSTLPGALSVDAGSQSLYDTPEKLAQLRRDLGGNPAVVAMSGPSELLETIGGEVVFEIFAFVAIVVALMNMFLVGRHTRARRGGRPGRTDPLGAGRPSAPPGRRARAGRSWPTWRSRWWCSPRPPGPGCRSAAPSCSAFAAGRGRGDLRRAHRGRGAGVRETRGRSTVRSAPPSAPRSSCGPPATSGNGALSWLSPIGWGQQTLPYVRHRWWPLLIPVVGRRRPGRAGRARAGPARLRRRPARRPGPGRATASAALGSPLGLAWRLQRGALIGWTLGLFVLGAAYGSVANSHRAVHRGQPRGGRVLPRRRCRQCGQRVPGRDHTDLGPDRRRVRRRPARCGPGPRRPPGGPSRYWPPGPAAGHGWAATSSSRWAAACWCSWPRASARAWRTGRRSPTPARSPGSWASRWSMCPRRGRSSPSRCSASAGYRARPAPSPGPRSGSARSSRSSPTWSTCRDGCGHLPVRPYASGATGERRTDTDADHRRRPHRDPRRRLRRLPPARRRLTRPGHVGPARRHQPVRTMGKMPK